MTWKFAQWWNSVSDDFSKITVFLLLKTRVAVMAKVSLGCKRLAHSLFSDPASMTAGMATMKCLQPQKHTSMAVISLTEHTISLGCKKPGAGKLTVWRPLHLGRSSLGKEAASTCKHDSPAEP